MAVFIADASITLAWCFEDESTSWTESLLEELRSDGEAVAPARWPTEVSNGLLTAVRRKRIAPEQPAQLWDKLDALSIAVKPPLTSVQAKAVLDLSQKHMLTAYDAAYLEPALRKALPLATLDDALSKAALLENAALISSR